MRTVRAFEVLSLAVPLALAGCSKESDREANSPSNTVGYEAPPAPNSTAEQHDPTQMTPASRVDESQGTITPAPRAPEAEKAPTLSDEQIAGIADAANTAEVSAAKYALTKAKNARVRKFAQMMIDHHGKAKQDQSKLLSKLDMTPAESSQQRQLKADAADTDRTLKAAPNDMFDKVYIDIQVADHQMVLDSLDRDFIPQAQNAELKRSLEDFRPKVQAHLDEALEIQKMLMSSGAEKSGSSSGKGQKGQSGTNGSDAASPKMK